MFNRSKAWYFGIAWPILVLALGAYVVVDCAWRPVPVTHHVVKVTFPFRATILPHAKTYSIRDDKVLECYGEGSYPNRYIECTVLSEQTAEGRKFYFVKIICNGYFNENIYVVDAQDIVKL